MLRTFSCNPVARPTQLRIKTSHLHSLFALTLLVSSFIILPNAHSAPRVISDNRVQWLTGLPSLGRGYTLDTNSLQSMCFEKTVSTEPTFDFDYVIKDVNSEFLAGLTANPLKGIESSYTREFLREHLLRAKEIKKKRGINIRTVLVHLKVSTYHASLDETQSTLSKSAIKLLKESRYDAFFNSCGFLYIRSVKRFSSYYALLQYNESGDPDKDNAFRARLENALLSFQQPEPKKTTNKSSSQQGKSGSSGFAAESETEYGWSEVFSTPQTQDNEQTFIQPAETEARNLRLYIQAVGLGKGDFDSLVPTSITEFKHTVQSAASLMQNPEAGIVSSIELASWIDNPEINELVSADNDDPVTAFRKLNSLELNTQVIADINSQRDFHLEKFYQANLCERVIFRDYPGNPDPTKEHSARYYDPLKTKFYNFHDLNKQELYISLYEFKQYFIRHPPIQLLSIVKKYLQGDPGEKNGALHCIETLHSIGLSNADFGNIPACVRALRGVDVDHMFLKEYCLPKPVQLTLEDPDDMPSTDSQSRADSEISELLTGTTIDFVHSSEKKRWVEDMVTEFQKENPDIRVRLTSMGSIAAATAISRGLIKPTAWSPAASANMALLEGAWARQTDLPPIIDRAGPDKPKSLVMSPLVFVAWQDRGQVLTANGTNPISPTLLSNAIKSDNNTWQGIGGPASWGNIKISHTNPLKSNSGLQTLILMAYDHNQGTERLTSNSLKAKGLVDFISSIEDTITDFGHSSGKLMNKLITYGPSALDGVFTYESLVLDKLKLAEKRYQPLIMFYPSNTVWSDHPAAVLKAKWVTPEQTRAARKLIDYLRDNTAQSQAAKYGFRPSDVEIPILGDDITTSFTHALPFGLRQSLPQALETPTPEVIRELMALWQDKISGKAKRRQKMKLNVPVPSAPPDFEEMPDNEMSPEQPVE